LKKGIPGKPKVTCEVALFCVFSMASS